MKQETRDMSSTIEVDEPVKMTLSSSSKSSPQRGTIKKEGRDESHERENSEERDRPPSKKATPRKSNSKNSSQSSSGRPRGGSYDKSSSKSSSYPYPKGSRYPHPGMTYGPPPPPYGSYDPHYRPPPPPPHYQQMPPMHPGQPGGYHYPPPPNYHPYSSHAYPPPGPMPYPPPPHPMYPSDSTSHESSKSKPSNSKLPRKKRTISYHRRDFSGTSTASSLSDAAMSLCSKGSKEDNPLTRASPKRRRGHNSNPISVDTGFDSRMSNSSTADSAARFQRLSVNDASRHDEQTNIFLTLSTSPINGEDVESTPISKNKKKPSTLHRKANSDDAYVSRTKSIDSAAEINKIIDRQAETPTPPLPPNKTNVLTDEHLLNTHLRGQTFTPLPPGDRESGSPTNINKSNSFAGIQPQLSWSIAGDAPSLGDLADWEEDRQKTEQARPASTTSQNSGNSRGMVLSPQSFTMWKEHDSNGKLRTASRDESLRLSMLSPHSDEDDEGEGERNGATTPLPFWGEGQGEERENSIRGTFSNASDKSNSERGHQNSYHRVPDNVSSIFVNRSSSKRSSNSKNSRWVHPQSEGRDAGGRGGMRMPPTPVYSEPEHHFGRSPPGRDGPPDSPYYPTYMGPPPHMSDRVRNLRGRAPPHHAPMPLQVPPPVSSHHSLTSPMGVPSKMWGVPHPSRHHMPPPPLELNPSKRKCVPLKPPIPSKFQGDIEKVKGAQVPEFTSLVNYPAHMSQKQSVNLPEGMRCCVMCGQACPCSSGNKNKKHPGASKKGNDTSAIDKNNGFAIIPTQNKGLCTLCDVNVWVVCQSGLEIKWCKGCKNFRPWAAFGDKGLATKCLRCRERQREKYALQKEEKEKARLLAKTKSSA